MSLVAGLAGCATAWPPPPRPSRPLPAFPSPPVLELASEAADRAELERRERLGEWRREMRRRGEGHRLSVAEWHWPLAYADQRRQVELAAEDGQLVGGEPLPDRGNKSKQAREGNQT